MAFCCLIFPMDLSGRICSTCSFWCPLKYLSYSSLRVYSTAVSCAPGCICSTTTLPPDMVVLQQTTLLERICSRAAFAVLGRVDVSILQQSVPPLDMYGQQQLVLSLHVSVVQLPLNVRVCCATAWAVCVILLPQAVSVQLSREGVGLYQLVLHLDVSVQQQPVLSREVSDQHQLVLHLDVSV